MSQVALADELGISRTPLREALRMLQSERLIEAEPNRRVRVAPMSAIDLEQLCIARVTLEAEAITPVGAPADFRGPGEAGGLHGRDGALRQCRGLPTLDGPHRNFHRALTAPARERINDLLGQLFDHTERYRRLHIGHGPTPWATAGHREILDACKAGECDRSAGLLAGHFARTGVEVANLLDPGYDLEALRTALLDVGGELPCTDGRRARRQLIV